jgi:hypothetical protein
MVMSERSQPYAVLRVRGGLAAAAKGADLQFAGLAMAAGCDAFGNITKLWYKRATFCSWRLGQ